MSAERAPTALVSGVLAVPDEGLFTPITLLTFDMSHVTEVRIIPQRPMPDTILWQGRVFWRERVRDPGGARRWHYVEVSVAELIE